MTLNNKTLPQFLSKVLALPLFASFATLAFWSPTAHAAPLVSIGDSADIYFDGYTSLEWSSNIFRDETDEVDDLLWRLVPGFELNVGRGVSNADLSLVTSYEIRSYAEEDQLDTELFRARLQGSYQTSRLDLAGSLFFREEKNSTGDTNVLSDLIESDSFGGRLNGEYRFSPKFSLGAGVRYSEREYASPYDSFFADRATTAFPFDLFYEWTPKVDLSVGYTYTETEVDGINPGTTGTRATTTYDQESHFFNVGARGNLLPKLTGFFKVGYRVRDNDDRLTQPFAAGAPTGPVVPVNGQDDGMLGLDADLTWAATPKLTARFGLSRDFGVGGEGQATENTSFDTNVHYSLNSYFSANAFGSYTIRDYETAREDNQYRLGARLSYAPDEFWSFGGGYTYTENDSNANGRSYTDHTFDLTASLRY